MADSKDKKDSALYRIDSKVGFNARVEPFWHTFRRLGPKMGFLARMKEKRRLKVLSSEILDGLRRHSIDPGDWMEQEGDCACNLRVAKIGLAEDLRTFVREQVPRKIASNWKTLMVQRESDAVIVPVAFSTPFKIGASGREILVTSAPRLRDNLEELNDRLGIEDSFDLAKISRVDFFEAGTKEIAVYESRYSMMEDFWGQFSYVLYRKLSEKSVESGFPILFA